MTQSQLLTELAQLRQRVAYLEAAEAKNKQTEEDLYHSRQMLQLVLDTIPQRVFWKDRNFSYLGCNKPFAKDADLTEPGEIVGKNDFELGWKEVAKLYRDDDDAVMTTGRPKLDFEEPQITPMGDQLWLRTTKVPLRDRDGTVIGILGTYEDITERKRTEDALLYERNLLRTLIDNLPDVIYVKDSACRKTIANRADIRNMGLQAEAEALGKDDYALYSMEVADKFFADDRSVIEHGEPVLNREEYFIDPAGQKHWLSTSKLPLRDAQGLVVGLMGIGRDITEQIRAEEALRNERNLLRAVVENMPDLFYFKDPLGRYVLNNRAHLRSMGVEHQEEVLGKFSASFHPPELARQYLEDEMEIVRTGQALLEKEELAVHKDTGEQRWHLTSKIPLKDSEGTTVGIVGISHDITEQKLAAAEREKLIRELQSALVDVKTLSGLVPICASCKKIRDDKGYWTQIEAYIQERTPAHFSHGICPDCVKILYPEYKPREKH
ncbi:MAG: PAS domain-containing protein [Ignavibacteriales bacterium]|nr:PAS domain-containing protein [Ignavibacteriales bacterium]